MAPGEENKEEEEKKVRVQAEPCLQAAVASCLPGMWQRRPAAQLPVPWGKEPVLQWWSLAAVTAEAKAMCGEV